MNRITLLLLAVSCSLFLSTVNAVTSVTSCGSFTVPGEYQLVNDITVSTEGCFDISPDAVRYGFVFDGNGFSLNYPQGAQYMRTFKIRGGWGNDSVVITNFKVNEGNGGYVMEISSLANVEISNNNFTGQAYPISLSGEVINVTVSNNIINGAVSAIDLSSAHGDYALIYENSITAASSTGVYLGTYANAWISENTLSNFAQRGSEGISLSGIYIDSTPDITVELNTFINGLQAIAVSNPTGVNFAFNNNEIFDFEYGANLLGGATLSQNIFSKSKVYINGAGDALVHGNAFYGCTLSLSNTGGAFVDANTFEDGTGIIVTTDSGTATITDNIIRKATLAVALFISVHNTNYAVVVSGNLIEDIDMVTSSFVVALTNGYTPDVVFANNTIRNISRSGCDTKNPMVVYISAASLIYSNNTITESVFRSPGCASLQRLYIVNADYSNYATFESSEISNIYSANGLSLTALAAWGGDSYFNASFVDLSIFNLATNFTDITGIFQMMSDVASYSNVVIRNITASDVNFHVPDYPGGGAVTGLYASPYYTAIIVNSEISGIKSSSYTGNNPACMGPKATGLSVDQPITLLLCGNTFTNIVGGTGCSITEGNRTVQADYDPLGTCNLLGVDPTNYCNNDTLPACDEETCLLQTSDCALLLDITDVVLSPDPVINPTTSGTTTTTTDGGETTTGGHGDATTGAVDTTTGGHDDTTTGDDGDADDTTTGGDGHGATTGGDGHGSTTGDEDDDDTTTGDDNDTTTGDEDDDDTTAGEDGHGASTGAAAATTSASTGSSKTTTTSSASSSKSTTTTGAQATSASASTSSNGAQGTTASAATSTNGATTALPTGAPTSMPTNAPTSAPGSTIVSTSVKASFSGDQSSFDLSGYTDTVAKQLNLTNTTSRIISTSKRADSFAVEVKGNIILPPNTPASTIQQYQNNTAFAESFATQLQTNPAFSSVLTGYTVKSVEATSTTSVVPTAPPTQPPTQPSTQPPTQPSTQPPTQPPTQSPTVSSSTTSSPEEASAVSTTVSIVILLVSILVCLL